MIFYRELHCTVGDLGGMESVVEDVEDERENEGSPADPQHCNEFVGIDLMIFSISVYNSDLLPRSDHQQGHHCQAELG